MLITRLKSPFWRVFISQRKPFNDPRSRVFTKDIGEWYVVIRRVGKKKISGKKRYYPMMAYHPQLGWIASIRSQQSHRERTYYNLCKPYNYASNAPANITFYPTHEVRDIVSGK